MILKFIFTSLMFLVMTSQRVNAYPQAPHCSQQHNTLEMIECWTKANQQLDKKLQSSWKKILTLPSNKLSFDQQKNRHAQNLWMQFRQTNCSKFNQGSLAAIMNAQCYYATTKARLREFHDLCQGLGDTPLC